MNRFGALGADCWRGWVPTVLAALSISLIGRRTTTQRVGAANAVVESRRYIVATQRRGIIPLDHAEAATGSG